MDVETPITQLLPAPHIISLRSGARSWVTVAVSTYPLFHKIGSLRLRRFQKVGVTGTGLLFRLDVSRARHGLWIRRSYGKSGHESLYVPVFNVHQARARRP